MRQTGCIEIAAACIDGDISEVDICADRRESDVAQPTKPQFFLRVQCAVNSPLLLDHFEKIAMVHDSFEHRPESEAIMSAERGREANDRDVALQAMRRAIFVRSLYSGVELRQNMAITIGPSASRMIEYRRFINIRGSCCVVSLVHDYCLERTRVELGQTRPP